MNCFLLKLGHSKDKKRALYDYGNLKDKPVHDMFLIKLYPCTETTEHELLSNLRKKYLHIG